MLSSREPYYHKESLEIAAQKFMNSVLVCRSQTFHRNILNSTKFYLLTVKITWDLFCWGPNLLKPVISNGLSGLPGALTKIPRSATLNAFGKFHLSLSIQAPSTLQWSGKLHPVIIFTAWNKEEYKFPLRTFTGVYIIFLTPWTVISQTILFQGF